MKEKLKDINQFIDLDLKDDYQSVYINMYNSKDEIKKLIINSIIMILSSILFVAVRFLTKDTKYDINNDNALFSQVSILDITISVIIFLIAIALFVTACLTFFFNVFTVVEIISDKEMINEFKQMSREDCLNRYLNSQIDDIKLIKDLNALYINKDNIVKRKYEFLDFDANDLNYLQFTDDINQFERVSDMNNDYSQLIIDQSEHTKLDYSDLQMILKNYIEIVKSNSHNKQSELQSNLIISDFSDVYERIMNKYSQRA